MVDVTRYAASTDVELVKRSWNDYLLQWQHLPPEQDMRVEYCNKH